MNDLSGLNPEGRDAIISKLAPQLMGNNQNNGHECDEVHQILIQAIKVLAEEVDSLSEKLGGYDKQNELYGNVVNGLLDIANDKIHEEEMGEFESKFGSEVGEYEEPWNALHPEGGHKPLKDTMFEALKELKGRSDYNDEMPSAFIKDRLGMLKGMIDKIKGVGQEPKAAEVTSLKVAPGDETPATEPVAAEKGAAFETPKSEELEPKPSKEVSDPVEETDAYGLTPSKIKEMKDKADASRKLVAERTKKSKK
jgi:hypothetical protein